MIMTTTVPVSVTDNKQFVPGKLSHFRYIYLISVMIVVLQMKHGGFKWFTVVSG
jgi:hypothetical protein